MDKLVPSALITLLCAIVLRSVVCGASIGDAITTVALSALFGYTLYLKSNTKPDPAATVAEDIAQLKSAVNALKLGRTLGGR